MLIEYYDAIRAKNARLERGRVIDSFGWAARYELCGEFSWAVPSKKALKVIARYSPIIEIGAGAGYWAYLLRKIGTDILAFDPAPPGSGKENRWIQAKRPWTEVLEGDHRQILLHPERNLMLCWPPMTDMAYQAAWLLGADRYLIYIGEGPFGCTADDNFFQLLEKQFEEVDFIQIPQWDGIYDAVWVYRKKGGK